MFPSNFMEIKKGEEYSALQVCYFMAHNNSHKGACQNVS